MKWSNLPKNKCPKCNRDFMLDLTTVPVTTRDGRREQLLAHGCGFKIYESRYKAIVSDMTLSKLEEEKLNQEGGEYLESEKA